MKSNTDFIRDLRKLNLQSTWKAQDRFDQLLLSHYSPDKSDLFLMIDLLKDRLCYHDTMNEMVYQLEMELVPAGNRLTAYLQKITIIFSDYCSSEEDSSPYLKEILATLIPLLVMVNGSCQQQDMFCDRLWDVLANPEEHLQEDLSTDLTDELEDMEKFVRELEKHYEMIWKLMDREKALILPLSVMTPVEQYLIKLLDLIERLMQPANNCTIQLSNTCLEIKAMEVQAEWN